jgi:hypothetical protein
MDYHLHVFLPVVMDEDHGSVPAGVITGKLSVFSAVDRGKILAVDLRRIPASLDVHKENCFFGEVLARLRCCGLYSGR